MNSIARRRFLSYPIALLGTAACGRVASTSFSTSAEDAGAPPPMFGESDAAPPLVYPPGNFPRVEVGTRFFSWTTPEQIAELRTTRTLFSQAERPGLGPGMLFQELAKIASTDPFANAVFALKLGRYAWTNPWATALGFFGEQYGSELIEMEVRPEALFVEVFEGKTRVVDTRGNVLDTASAFRESKRIVGAIHWNKATVGGGSWYSRPALGCTDGGLTPEDNAFREVYLGNLAMVRSWSFRTTELRATLDAAIGSKRALTAMVMNDPGAVSDCEWALGTLRTLSYEITATTLEGQHQLGLCFFSPEYRPLRSRVERLADVLAERLFLPDGFRVDL
jgi:hypothetical protein